MQTAQIKFNYFSCCSLVSSLYILRPLELEAIWRRFSFLRTSLAQRVPRSKGKTLHFEPLNQESSTNSLLTKEAPQNHANTSVERYSSGCSRGAGGQVPPPQYFENYKELVRKSVLCPPPPILNH